MPVTQLALAVVVIVMLAIRRPLTLPPRPPPPRALLPVRQFRLLLLSYQVLRYPILHGILKVCSRLWEVVVGGLLVGTPSS